MTARLGTRGTPRLPNRYTVHVSALTILQRAPRILTEGAVIERLRRDPAVTLDPHVLHARLLYDPAGRACLAAVYRQYITIAADAGLPLILGTPTWRANAERLRAAGLADRDVNGDAVRFLAELRTASGTLADRICIGGLVGCCGDAYQPREALGEDEAAAFHEPHVAALAHAGVDFLHAATLPACCEALGLARAMAAQRVPYVLSFVLRPTGALLDGTPLHEAVRSIDAAVTPAPLGYLANCVHPDVFFAALHGVTAADPAVRVRIIGLQANTSTLSPEQLDGRAELDSMAPDAFATAMLDVHLRFGTRILGGCCGTDDHHIRQLAAVLTRPRSPMV